jgi:hypothetical protein
VQSVQAFLNCYVIPNAIEFCMAVKETCPLIMLNQRDPRAQMTVKPLVSVLQLQHQYLRHTL